MLPVPGTAADFILQAPRLTETHRPGSITRTSSWSHCFRQIRPVKNVIHKNAIFFLHKHITGFHIFSKNFQTHWLRHRLEQGLPTADPKKEYTCQKGLLAANGAQIRNQSPEPLLAGASHAQGNHRWSLRLLNCLPTVWANLHKGVCGLYFNQWAKTHPLCSYSLICIFTNQRGSVTTNQDSTMWTSQTTNLDSSSA